MLGRGRKERGTTLCLRECEKIFQDLDNKEMEQKPKKKKENEQPRERKRDKTKNGLEREK